MAVKFKSLDVDRCEGNNEYVQTRLGVLPFFIIETCG